MVTDPDCIFCKIVAGEIPSLKIDEDDKTLGFMDINPWTKGHALVIPKEHSRNIYDADPEDLAAAHKAAQRIAQRMRERLDCEGINVLQSSEPVAMQTVFHTHVHVIPRYSDDGLRLPAHPQPAEHEELAELAEQLRA
ncbi:MAG TPA: HIT family protein [Thermoleophilaceae bacterium]|jgi:histidine triad (HIT) family protein|nr:HIT family protein [Thermoleophilaceae bacterium]